MEKVYKKVLNNDGTETPYSISNFGDIVYTNSKEKVKVRYITYAVYNHKKYPLRKPRPVISLKLNGKYVTLGIYRLEMMTFHPLDDYTGMEVDHLDGNPDNNIITNLEWVTSAENKRRAKEKRLLRHDEDHPNSVYSDELIHNICNEICIGTRRKDIKLKYNVNGQLIDDIRSGRSHRYISELYLEKGFVYKEKKSKKEKKERERLIKKICKLIDKGYSNKEIYEMLNLPKNELCLPNDVRKHRVYKYISSDYNF